MTLLEIRLFREIEGFMGEPQDSYATYDYVIMWQAARINAKRVLIRHGENIDEYNTSCIPRVVGADNILDKIYIEHKDKLYPHEFLA